MMEMWNEVCCLTLGIGDLEHWLPRQRAAPSRASGLSRAMEMTEAAEGVMHRAEGEGTGPGSGLLVIARPCTRHWAVLYIGVPAHLQWCRNSGWLTWWKQPQSPSFEL